MRLAHVRDRDNVNRATPITNSFATRTSDVDQLVSRYVASTRGFSSLTSDSDVITVRVEPLSRVPPEASRR